MKLEPKNTIRFSIPIKDPKRKDNSNFFFLKKKLDKDIKKIELSEIIIHAHIILNFKIKLLF
jgi:hypothetical protein